MLRVGSEGQAQEDGAKVPEVSKLALELSKSPLTGAAWKPAGHSPRERAAKSVIAEKLGMSEGTQQPLSAEEHL